MKRKIFNGLLAAGMFLISGYLFLIESITLPSKYGSFPSSYESPVTYLMGLMPLSFGVALVLSLLNAARFKQHCSVIVIIGVVAFFIGIVVVEPILKAYQ